MKKKNQVKNQAVILCCVLVATLVSMGCEQPMAKCQVGIGEHAAKYTRISGQGACSLIEGEVFGLHTYYYATSDRTHSDYDRARMAIKPAGLGELSAYAEYRGVVDSDAGHQPYSIGDFDVSEPDADSFCYVSTVSTTEQHLPYIPADGEDPEQQEVHLRYEWSNFRSLVSAAYMGSQWSANLTYTDVLQGCTAQYEVWGVMGAHSCADDDGTPNDARCATEPDPEAGIFDGSGINPDFSVTCDPDLLICVLTQAPPALK